MPGEPDSSIRKGVLAEYAVFLKRHKMWWTMPTAIVLVILVGLVAFSAGEGVIDIYAVF